MICIQYIFFFVFFSFIRFMLFFCFVFVTFYHSNVNFVNDPEMIPILMQPPNNFQIITLHEGTFGSTKHIYSFCFFFNKNLFHNDLLSYVHPSTSAIFNSFSRTRIKKKNVCSFIHSLFWFGHFISIAMAISHYKLQFFFMILFYLIESMERGFIVSEHHG